MTNIKFVKDELYESISLKRDSKNLMIWLEYLNDSLRKLNIPKIDGILISISNSISKSYYYNAIDLLDDLKPEIANITEKCLIDVINGSEGIAIELLDDSYEYILPNKYCQNIEMLEIQGNYQNDIHNNEFISALEKLYSLNSLIESIEYYYNPNQFKLSL
ncbi:MAG: hypothetical protein [Cryophage ML09]|nr:MAG: hypothetical protein [Cryophage ML09]